MLIGRKTRESCDLQGYALNLQPAVLHTSGTHSSHTYTCCQAETGKEKKRADRCIAQKK